MKAILNNEKEIAIVMNRAELIRICNALWDSVEYCKSKELYTLAKFNKLLATETGKIYEDCFK